jgi:Uma2 family endonuclease
MKVVHRVGCYLWKQKFRGSDRILSKTFPELELTVEQVIESSQLRKL